MAFKSTKNAIWTPNPGSQVSFLRCPAHEALLHGNRGGGKTDCLLMDFLQHVGVGYGMEWRGILFREEYTQLTDVINKSKKWISQIFPGAKYNGSEHKWTFPDGETLYLRYMRVPSDYWAYHGHEYPWIGWEELTNWATDECYLSMMSCNRCSDPDVPRKYRATCNPSGPKHSWVKERFIDSVDELKVYVDPKSGKSRAHIQLKLEENTIFLDADPGYQRTIIEATKDDEAKYKAWVLGSWEVPAGGFFADVWDKSIHVLPYFQIPSSWKVFRSFDWGSQKPWAVTYIAECDGEQPIGYGLVENFPYFPRGTMVVFQELYGWNGKANEGDPENATSQAIADRVLSLDAAIEREFRVRVLPGPADNSIYNVTDGVSIGGNMRTYGLHWRPAYKGHGSRISGWALVRTMLSAAKRKDIENPHLYFCEAARHHIRTLPLMQRDKLKPEDIDSDLEDHCMDSLRYGITKKLSAMGHKSIRY